MYVDTGLKLYSTTGVFLIPFGDSKKYKSHQFGINSNVVMEFESNYFKW